jgi:hypothetical protein
LIPLTSLAIVVTLTVEGRSEEASKATAGRSFREGYKALVIRTYYERNGWTHTVFVWTSARTGWVW